ncbi:MAG: FecR domain-containing protein, partial [Myxococcota bacterium]
SACVARVGEVLSAEPGLLTVTVSADAGRFPDPLKEAGVVRDALAKAGVPRALISMNAPRGLRDLLTLTYVARSLDSVAQVSGLSGNAEVDMGDAGLRPLVLGAQVKSGARVVTGDGALLELRLADSSRVRLFENGELRVGALDFDRNRRVRVRLDLVAGETQILAHSEEQAGTFDVHTETAVAGVKGTEFSVGDPRESRTATYKGAVELVNAQGTVRVNKGFASRIGPDGGPESPRPLLGAPTIRSPLTGVVDNPVSLEWNESGAARVEIARDPQFRVELQVLEASSKSTRPTLESGKWYWRVALVDEIGVRGFYSRIYAFEVQ